MQLLLFTFVYSLKKDIVVLLQNLVFEQEVTDSRIETTLEILQVTAEYFETNFSVICNYPLSKTIEYQLSIPEGGKISWSLLEMEKILFDSCVPFLSILTSAFKHTYMHSKVCGFPCEDNIFYVDLQCKDRKES